jgi:predicted methyltransferase
MVSLRLPLALALVTTIAAFGCGSTETPPAASPPGSVSTPAAAGGSAVDAKLVAAIAGPQRTEAERARDAFRHPRETLEFFGLKDDMNVVELSPGEGWYTAIIAPVVFEHGKLSVTTSDPNGPPASEATQNAKALLDRFAKHPEAFGKVNPMVVRWKADPISLGPDGSADMVLTFRNAHNWIEAGIFDKVLGAISKVLKPGGVLGLTDHRANVGGPTDAKKIGDTGYVPEAFLIAQVEAAGFKLADKSEVNANPKDTKDYPKGVWTLPPTYELKDVDRAKYQAIGESDRMTLKFVKR